MSDPRIFQLLHTCHRALFRAADRALGAGFGITAAQHGLLLFLQRHEGATLGEAAKALGLRNAATSGLVDRMEAKGLVCRVQSQSDKRACSLFTTENGKAAVAETLPLIREANSMMLDGFTDEEKAALARALEIITARANVFGPGETDKA